MGELLEHRVKRLKMRSMRRGIKEMDLILSAFADSHLEKMTEADLTLYDAMLSENDQNRNNNQGPALSKHQAVIEIEAY